MMDILSEESLILPKRYAYICENNVTAALLLSQFERDFDIEQECAKLERRDEQVWLYNNAILAKNLYNLYSWTEIYDAVRYLGNKEYISHRWHKEDDDRPLETRLYYAQFNYWNVTEASIPYNEEVQRQREARWKQEQPFPEAQPSTPRSIKLENKYKIEASRVEVHCKRASDEGLPASLTLEQWIQTLNDFEWKCAYCKGKYSVIEHYIPLNHGSGTTVDNCVPACHKCNSTKAHHHPTLMPATTGMVEAIERVQQYLETRRSEAAL